ncbi:MAG: magnesium/cobalt transporter CorA [Cyclobacteriaceae bacterium]
MITLIQYNKSKYFVEENLKAAEALRLVKSSHITWIDKEGLERETLQEITSNFDIHTLTVDDIVTLELLPKFEVFDEYIFFSANMLKWEDDDTISQEKVSITLKKDVLITYQEGIPGDVFDDLREKISHGRGVIRNHKVDYLFYQIISSIVSNYSHIAERLRTKIEEMEDNLLTDNNYDVMQDVITIKRKVNMIRRYAIPLLDAITSMKTEGEQYLKKANNAYLHDLQDQVRYILSFCDTSREMLRDIMDLHQTNQSNEMNRVMKTLTIVSAIFIPMTFLAGIYGMNFEAMPELHWRYGYFSVLGLMLLVAGTIFYILKKKNWL